MALKREHRLTLTLVMVTWTMSGVLYLVPQQLFARIDLFTTLSVIKICTLGMLLSGLVYWAVRATRRRSVIARIGVTVATAFIASALLALVDTASGDWMSDLMMPPERSVPFAFRATNNFVALVWQFGLLGAAFTVIEANQLTRERELDLATAREAASRAEAAATAASLAALRYQLNPHFLFNTLNAISSLIVTRDYDAADAMLAKLSEFLRATLASQPDALLPLEDELATLQHYLEIESARFGDRLAVEFVCPPELNRALVPGFLLQPLVENAIKYALAPSAEPVTIRVEAARDGDQLAVCVEDDGAANPGEAKSGTGLGLANVRARLNALYSAAGSLETLRRDRGFIAIARLPLNLNGDGIPA